MPESVFEEGPFVCESIRTKTVLCPFESQLARLRGGNPLKQVGGPSPGCPSQPRSEAGAPYLAKMHGLNDSEKLHSTNIGASGTLRLIHQNTTAPSARRLDSFISP